MKGGAKEGYWLSIAPTRKGCGVVVADRKGKPLYCQRVPWDELAPCLHHLFVTYHPRRFIIGMGWRNRWVQALLCTFSPKAWLVLVRPEAVSPTSDLTNFALRLLYHYLHRE